MGFMIHFSVIMLKRRTQSQALQIKQAITYDEVALFHNQDLQIRFPLLFKNYQMPWG